MVLNTLGSIVKSVIISVLILVLALLIFGYATSAEVKQTVNGHLSSIKSLVSSSLHKAAEAPQNLKMTAQGTSCETLAKSLIPKYVFLKSCMSYDYITFADEQIWLDGTSIGIEENIDVFNLCNIRFGSGSAQGENINYLYTRQSSLLYSKNIISPDGVILGTRSFKVRPVLKKAMLANYGWITSRGEYEYVGVNRQVDKSGAGIGTWFEWSGFTDEVKKTLNITELKIEVTTITLAGERTICSMAGVNESGKLICEAGEYRGLILNTKPDFVNQDLYEVVSADVNDCNWVDAPLNR